VTAITQAAKREEVARDARRPDLQFERPAARDRRSLCREGQRGSSPARYRQVMDQVMNADHFDPSLGRVESLLA